MFPLDIPFNSQGTTHQGTLLFLHANSYSSRMYQPFLKPLYPDYKVLSPDLPGHGQSRWTGQIYDWEDLADYFIAHFDEVGVPSKLVGMGHSIGGIVIMMMAIKRPHWFSKIILLDPVLLPKKLLWIIRGLRIASLTHLIPLARAANRRKWKFLSKTTALEHYSKKPVFARWEHQFLEAYVETCLHTTSKGDVQLSCSPQLESSIYQSLPLNAWKLPGQIQTPSLYIIGTFSDTVSSRGFDRLTKSHGNPIVKSVEGGHLFPFEKPKESMVLIKDFLGL